MKKLSLSCAVISLITANQAFSRSLDIDISSESVSAEYNFSRQDADLGLYTGVLLTEDNGDVAYATARTQATLPQQRNISGGFGGRAYHASPETGDDFQALAFGGYIDVSVPNMDALTFGLEYYYAPSSTVTDDLDNLSEVGLRVSYQLFKNAAIYGGYRLLEAEVGDFDLEIDDKAHLGFSVQF